MIRAVKKAIQSNAEKAPFEYVDYLLIKNLYHCTPEELDHQDEFITDMHIEFMNLESKEEMLRHKRAEQAAKIKRQ